MEKNLTEKAFKEELKGLNIRDYDEFDERFRQYLIEKENLGSIKPSSEKEIKEILSTWIHFFKNSFYSEILSENFGLNYSEELSKKFHEKYLEIILKGGSKDSYEDTAKYFMENK